MQYPPNPQEYTQYPQYPQYPPEQPAPKKTGSTLLLILGIIAAVLILSCIGVSALISTVAKNVNTGTLTSTSNNTTTASSEDTNNSQPTAIPTPIPTLAPVALSGVGQQASNKFQLQEGLAIFKLTHTGSANFIVHLLDSNGQYVDDLVNEIGTFDGCKAEGIKNAGTYVLDIQAEGKWTVTILQPRQTTAPYTTSFSGKGQQATKLFSMKSGLKTKKLTHTGSANFIVHLLDSNGQYVDDLVNEIGTFHGSKAEGIQDDGIYLFDIQADGNWTITLE